MTQTRFLVRRAHPLHVTNRQAVPTHVRPDQRNIDTDDIALGDLGIDVGMHRALKYPAKPVFASSLTDACQGRVIRKQAIADEPPHGDVDLGLAHRLAVVDDPSRKPASMRRTATSGSIPGCSFATREHGGKGIGGFFVAYRIFAFVSVSK